MSAPAEPVERRVVRRLDTGSVARVAFAFSMTLVAILLVGFVALYLLGAASGALAGVESFISSLGWADFQFRFAAVLGLTLLLGLAGALLFTLLTVVGAALYNVLAELVGGIEVVSRDR